MAITRYHDDPKTSLSLGFHNTGTAVPLFNTPSTDMSHPIQHPSHVSQQDIDPQLLADEEDDGGDMGGDQTGGTAHAMNMQWHPDYTQSPSAPPRIVSSQMQQQQQGRPQSSPSQLNPRPSTSNSQQQPQMPSRNHTNHVSGSPTSGSGSRMTPQTPIQAQYSTAMTVSSPDGFADPQTQMIQILAHLTSVTQSLLEACTALTETLRSQDGGGVKRSSTSKEDGMDKKQKATLATEVLANSAVDEEVRRAAADYLKRLFHE